MKVKQIRKALVAVAGVAATLLSHGVLHGTAATVVADIVGALTALGVYAVPNAPVSK